MPPSCSPPSALFVVGMVAAMTSAGCRSGSRERVEATLPASSSGPPIDPTIASLDSRARYEKAAELMSAFAERSGLTGDRAQRRYLWTDAFAVCNYLGLAQATGQARYSQLALRLVDRVHHVLGMHRGDERRTGWLSGLDEREGEAHPTLGGLRIGKELPEREPDEPFDERREWDRDGQYFHYLTKWMHALDQAAWATGQGTLDAWGRELAVTAHRAFAYGSGAGRRMYWKMSIDLSRPLVSSMGQHDALDGYVTCEELRAGARGWPDAAAGHELDDAIADFGSMIDRGNLETSDPLGLGGLMEDAYRLTQLAGQGASVDDRLRDALLEAAAAGLEHYVEEGDLKRPATQRLAFRELGLAIGLDAVAAMRRAGAPASSPDGRAAMERLRRYDALRDEIVAFWLEPEHRETAAWTEHRDIDDVMLATALAPEGCLVLSSGFRRR